jgi:hypothetical protein
MDALVTPAYEVERWVSKKLGRPPHQPELFTTEDVEVDLWLPVARADAAAQAIAVLDRSWRLALTLTEAAEHASRPEWPLEALLATPEAGGLHLVAAAPGSFQATLRVAPKKLQRVVPHAVTAGALLAIIPTVAQTVDLMIPDAEHEHVPVKIAPLSPRTEQEVSIVVGRPPPSTSSRITIELNDGSKVIVKVQGAARAHRAPAGRAARHRAAAK